ncbi:MAG: hypothetical protein OXH00_21545 [Candidatus Poribacteria bacterium]|nr:hypothetical protein [Candidatus Poribacteria bacterium]
MVTKFQLINKEGKVLADGEIENDVYRVFSAQFPNGYKEFKHLEDIYAECGGNAIQPEMFCSPASTRQLGLFDE